MTHADEARRIAPPESYGTLCNEIAAALAAAERRGIMAAAHEINRIRFTDYAVIGCRLQWHAAFDLEMAVRALLPECSGISGELPAEPAAKCATCGGHGRTTPSGKCLDAFHPETRLRMTTVPCLVCAAGGGK